MSINNLYNISIILDKRRVKENGFYPVKLRVYSKSLGKGKLYTVGIDLTKKGFEHIWTNGNKNSLRGENREIQVKLQKILSKANEAIGELGYFSFIQFEKKYFRKSSDGNNVYFHYNREIQTFNKKDKIGTASNYTYSLKSIQDFVLHKTGKNVEKLSFETITVDWLEEYEQHLLTEGKSVTTVGIYLRPLRAIFNTAIDENDINREIYPFGKRKYQIPQSKKVKKALNSEQLSLLYHSKPNTPERQRAKDFWFFSYACNGMNLKDIALLKYDDIKNDKFSYYRAKTFSKSNTKSKIEIYLTEFIKEIIAQYGTGDYNGYVFSILQNVDDEMSNHRNIKNFTRFINQHIKNHAKSIGLPEDISSYWARHSFTTNAIRKGASMEFVSEALNHSDLKVTKNYFAGFEDEAKKEFAEKLMDF